MKAKWDHTVRIMWRRSSSLMWQGLTSSQGKGVGSECCSRTQMKDWFTYTQLNIKNFLRNASSLQKMEESYPLIRIERRNRTCRYELIVWWTREKDFGSLVLDDIFPVLFFLLRVGCKIEFSSACVNNKAVLAQCRYRAHRIIIDERQSQ